MNVLDGVVGFDAIEGFADAAERDASQHHHHHHGRLHSSHHGHHHHGHHHTGRLRSRASSTGKKVDATFDDELDTPVGVRSTALDATAELVGADGIPMVADEDDMQRNAQEVEDGGSDDEGVSAAAALLAQIETLYEQLDDVRAKRDTRQPGTSTRSTRGRHHPPMPPTTGRTILVSNVLPFTVHKGLDGAWASVARPNVPRQHAHTCFSALHAEPTSRIVWMGEAGTSIEPGVDRNTLRHQLLTEYRYYPVFLTPRERELHYSGYCKSVLYPTFHSIPFSTDFHVNTHDTDEPQDNAERMWQAFTAVNEAFAEAVAAVYEPGDQVWVYGYHLMMLPSLLRRMLPQAAVGFFLQLPHREALLNGCLSADLIGFQIYNYAKHFRACCSLLLGLESTPVAVRYNGSMTQLCVCPMGIEPRECAITVSTEAVQRRILELRDTYQDKIVIIGVDKLDDANGLVMKLRTLNRLLQLRPNLRKRVVLVQVTSAPTGVTGPRSRMISGLQARINTMIGRLNGKFSRVARMPPAVHVSKALQFEELCAMYAIADIALVTPVRGGVNPVPFEYVVCREAAGQAACVVLSEFTASASLLKPGPLLVNPYDVDQTCEALVEAINLPSEKLWSGHRQMFRYVTSHTSTSWSRSFLGRLHSLQWPNGRATLSLTRPLATSPIVSAFDAASRRVVVVDLDGIIVDWDAMDQLFTSPSHMPIPPSITRLCHQPHTVVVVVSGHSCAVMEAVCGHLNCVLVAERGCYLRWSPLHVWEELVDAEEPSGLLVQVVPPCQYYADRTPGSHVEVKSHSVTFHYRDCPAAQLHQVFTLHATLEDLVRRLPLLVFQGDKWLEVRPADAGKAPAVDVVLRRLSCVCHPSEHATPPPSTVSYRGRRGSEDDGTMATTTTGTAFSVCDGAVDGVISDTVVAAVAPGTATVEHVSTHTMHRRSSGSTSAQMSPQSAIPGQDEGSGQAHGPTAASAAAPAATATPTVRVTPRPRQDGPLARGQTPIPLPSSSSSASSPPLSLSPHECGTGGGGGGGGGGDSDIVASRVDVGRIPLDGVGTVPHATMDTAAHHTHRRHTPGAMPHTNSFGGRSAVSDTFSAALGGATAFGRPALPVDFVFVACSGGNLTDEAVFKSIMQLVKRARRQGPSSSLSSSTVVAPPVQTVAPADILMPSVGGGGGGGGGGKSIQPTNGGGTTAMDVGGVNGDDGGCGGGVDSGSADVGTAGSVSPSLQPLRGSSERGGHPVTAGTRCDAVVGGEGTPITSATAVRVAAGATDAPGAVDHHGGGGGAAAAAAADDDDDNNHDPNQYQPVRAAATPAAGAGAGAFSLDTDRRSSSGSAGAWVPPAPVWPTDPPHVPLLCDTVRVFLSRLGTGPTQAHYYMDAAQDYRSLLQVLAARDEASTVVPPGRDHHTSFTSTSAPTAPLS